MRHRPGSRRPALTEEQKRKKPPVSQPLVRVHPLTERQVLYANPGYTMWIDGMDRLEGDKILDYLFRHQDGLIFSTRISGGGDVLMWEYIATLDIPTFGPLTYH
jgi:taurine dioxygenase